ncbi:hypothetical protein ACWDO6_14580 [Streptomyces sp. NPDC003674]
MRLADTTGDGRAELYGGAPGGTRAPARCGRSRAPPRR